MAHWPNLPYGLFLYGPQSKNTFTFLKCLVKQRKMCDSGLIRLRKPEVLLSGPL